MWQPAPEAVRARFRRPLPHKGRDLANVLSDFTSHIKPYATGNTHPLFMGWVHGAGTPVGMLAEMLAAGLNANCGGRNHIGIDVERQMTRWFAQVFGFPQRRLGRVRHRHLDGQLPGPADRPQRGAGPLRPRRGAARSPGAARPPTPPRRPTAASPRRSSSPASARANLRQVPVDAAGAMRLDRLKAAIAKDRRRGHQPFLVVGTAGSVNTGAMDDLDAIADSRRGAQALVPRRRGVRRARRAVQAPAPAGGRHRARPVDRLRSAQVGARPLRRRLPAGTRRRGAPAHLRQPGRLPAAGAARAGRRRGVAVRPGAGPVARVSRAESVVHVGDARRRPDRGLHRALLPRGAASGAAAAKVADVRGGGPGGAQHRLLQGARRRRRRAASRRHGPAGARASPPRR